MLKHKIKDSVLVTALAGVSLCLTSCDWGVLGSSPDPVTVHPPIIEPTAVTLDPKPKALTPPIAKPLESRPGFVLNPYTGTIVDVRGLASGLLVRDPEDPDKTHTFYVP